MNRENDLPCKALPPIGALFKAITGKASPVSVSKGHNRISVGADTVHQNALPFNSSGSGGGGPIPIPGHSAVAGTPTVSGRNETAGMSDANQPVAAACPVNAARLEVYQNAAVVTPASTVHYHMPYARENNFVQGYSLAYGHPAAPVTRAVVSGDNNPVRNAAVGSLYEWNTPYVPDQESKQRVYIQGEIKEDFHGQVVPGNENTGSKSTVKASPVPHFENQAYPTSNIVGGSHIQSPYVPAQVDSRHVAHHPGDSKAVVHPVRGSKYPQYQAAQYGRVVPADHADPGVRHENFASVANNGAISDAGALYGGIGSAAGVRGSESGQEMFHGNRSHVQKHFLPEHEKQTSGGRAFPHPMPPQVPRSRDLGEMKSAMQGSLENPKQPANRVSVHAPAQTLGHAFCNAGGQSPGPDLAKLQTEALLQAQAQAQVVAQLQAQLRLHTPAAAHTANHSSPAIYGPTGGPPHAEVHPVAQNRVQGLPVRHFPIPATAQLSSVSGNHLRTLPYDTVVYHNHLSAFGSQALGSSATPRPINFPSANGGTALGILQNGCLRKQRKVRRNWSTAENQIFFRIVKAGKAQRKTDREIVDAVLQHLGHLRTARQVQGHLRNMRNSNKMQEYGVEHNNQG